MPEPFMEHPTGEFKTAIDAMADAIRRLRKLRAWTEPIRFDAQGMGHREDSDDFADITLTNNEFKLDEPIDVDTITRAAGVGRSCLTKNGEFYSLAGASPAEAAKILDAIFRHMGIRPHPDEGDDYAVGAEWETPPADSAEDDSKPTKRPWWRLW